MVLALAIPGLHAGMGRAADASAHSPGSASFCLFEVPSEESGKRRLINLPIVQYVETSRSEVRIYYGGGNFGAGHETRIAVNSAEQANTWLERLQQTAAACAQAAK